jgi:hypothetical protein
VNISPLQIPFELSYRREVLLAVELLDAVTLERVSQGIKVNAEGLQAKPVLNASGLFVWLGKDEDFAVLRRISVDPGLRPYEKVEREAAHVLRPLTRIELPPRIDYPFASGITGLRGTLIERPVISPEQPDPVRDGKVRLRWLDDDGQWKDGVVTSRTDPKRGDFVSILRLAPDEKPNVDADGLITVRLRVSREGVNDRNSADLKLLPGRIKNPSDSNRLTFAWNELTL